MPLREDRQRRLEELRAKYPKPKPPMGPKHYSSYLLISLKFDFKAVSQVEADKASFDWMWHKGHEAAEMIHRAFVKDGLRDVSLIQEVKGTSEPEEEGWEE